MGTAQAAATKPATAPVPSDAKGVWERALSILAKNEPPIFGLLKNERFLGVKGTSYQVLIPFAKKDFSFVRLNQPARRERIAQALSEAAGAPVQFEAVLEQDVSEKKLDSVRDEAQQSLIEAFGRETVQIDEEKSSR